MGNKNIIQLDERMMYLYNKYTEKAIKYDKLWIEEEIEELGNSLKSLIQGNFLKSNFFQNKANNISNRMNDLLLYGD